MERAVVSVFVLVFAFVFFLPMSNSVPAPPPRSLGPPAQSSRPLCISQFALVNHACAAIPYMPIPPPAPIPAPPHGHSHRHGHHHRHRHDHNHDHDHDRDRHEETPTQQECCRWLKEVDNQCVCDVLIRLPAFLSRPLHNYTITVDQNCIVTYQCAGRLVPV